MKKFPIFWFESNQYFNWVESLEQLDVVIEIFNNSYRNKYWILDRAKNYGSVDKNVKHKPNFGTRYEHHNGTVTLREYLNSHGYYFDKNKLRIKKLKNIMNEKDKLKQELDETKRKLAELEEKEKNSERNDAIRKLEDISVDDKVKFFDKLFNCAMSELDELEEKGYSDEDNAAYAWETYIEILGTEHNKFWKYWNSLS